MLPPPVTLCQLSETELRRKPIKYFVKFNLNMPCFGRHLSPADNRNRLKSFSCV